MCAYVLGPRPSATLGPPIQTDDISEALYRAWLNEPWTKNPIDQKADTFLLVDPVTDVQITSPDAAPPDSIIGFYHRHPSGTTCPTRPATPQKELDRGLVLNHVVRTPTAHDIKEGEVAKNVAYGFNNGNGFPPGSVAPRPWTANAMEQLYDWSTEIIKTPFELKPCGGTPPTCAGCSCEGADCQRNYAFAVRVSDVAARLRKHFPNVA